MAGQCGPTRVVQRGGERVVECRDLTIARTMGLYYASINVGAFVALGSVWAEARIGFWAAFAIPGAIFLMMPPLLAVVRPRLAPEPAPSSSALARVWAVMRSRAPAPAPAPAPSVFPRVPRPLRGDAEETHRLGSDSESDSVSASASASECDSGIDSDSDRGRSDAERGPPAREADGADADGTGDGDIRRALEACALFAWFAVYNVAPGLGSVTISLAGAMRPTLPNDALDKLNPLAVIVAVPVLGWAYPRLEARGVRVGPVRRVVIGFGLTSLGTYTCSG